MIARSPRHTIVSASLTFVLILIGGCGARPDAGASSSPPGLTEVEWQLTELTGQPVIPSKGERQPYVKFHEAESRFEGFSGCNSMNGRYSLSGSELRLEGPVAMTRMACLDQSMNAQEQTLAQVLGEMNRYTITGNELTIYGERGQLASFEPAPPEPSASPEQ